MSEESPNPTKRLLFYSSDSDDSNHGGVKPKHITTTVAVRRGHYIDDEASASNDSEDDSIDEEESDMDDFIAHSSEEEEEEEEPRVPPPPPPAVPQPPPPPGRAPPKQSQLVHHPTVAGEEAEENTYNGKKFRAWIITLNGIDFNQREEYMDQLIALQPKYAVIGNETGESGNKHFQGVIYFNTLRHFKATRNALKFHGRFPHIEPCKDIAASIEYCMKDMQFIEWGTRPMTQKEKGEKTQAMWDETRVAAEEGRMEDINSRIFITHYKSLKAIHNDKLLSKKLTNAPCQHYWFVGDTGSGKSWRAREMFNMDEEFYYVHLLEPKWWDGYKGEEVVIFDDVPQDKRYIDWIKTWCDVYPFKAEYKGGSLKARPKCFIFTSNFYLQQIQPDPVLLAPAMRRVKQVFFPQLINIDQPELGRNEEQVPLYHENVIHFDNFALKEGLHPLYVQHVEQQQQAAQEAQEDN